MPAQEWTCCYLPHVLRKINRVSFGLLQDAGAQQWTEQPQSRQLLAIPFIGKDTPAPAAEFAQPDVLIGVTALAYRYEGLRLRNLKAVVCQLKAAMQLESGPAAQRPTYKMFEQWKEAAKRRLRAAAATTAAGQEVVARQLGTDTVNLEQFQAGDAAQMEELFKLLRREPDVIRYFLRKIGACAALSFSLPVLNHCCCCCCCCCCSNSSGCGVTRLRACHSRVAVLDVPCARSVPQHYGAAAAQDQR